MRIRTIVTAFGSLAWCAFVPAQPAPVDLMTAMDHGPFVSSTLTDDPLSDYIHRIVAHTKLAAPGETVWLELAVPATPGVNPYNCTVSGHFSLRQGQLVVTK